MQKSFLWRVRKGRGLKSVDDYLLKKNGENLDSSGLILKFAVLDRGPEQRRKNTKVSY